MSVQKGDKVKIQYTGTFDDGTEFDSSKKHGQALEFTAGEGQVIKGFDDAVIGMQKGDAKKFSVTPEQGYGNQSDELIKQVPKNAIKTDQELQPGMMLQMTLPNGQQYPGTITKVEAETITVDLNHPLAGKTLHFDITLEGVNE
ncbi:MAG: FKBP-type peptidyl-prolyl cis-trans isomerase [Candidatus Woesearchaeota archaeon]